MPRLVRGGLIQASVGEETSAPLDHLKKLLIDKHVALIEEAARRGVQVLCLQELFYGPYFPAEQNPRWYAMVERVPEGPTVSLMQTLARKHRLVMIVPVYEEDMTGVYYNTAAVIDADGAYLGKYRKNHLPHSGRGRGGGPRPRPDPRSPQRVAVLPRPAAGDLRTAHRALAGPAVPDGDRGPVA